MVRLFVCMSYNQVKFYVKLEVQFELESQSLTLLVCLAFSESTGLHSLSLQKMFLAPRDAQMFWHVCGVI
jgi:hypothetical protein